MRSPMSSAKKMYCAAWMARLTGQRYQERRKRMLSTCTWYHGWSHLVRRRRVDAAAAGRQDVVLPAALQARKRVRVLGLR